MSCKDDEATLRHERNITGKSDATILSSRFCSAYLPLSMYTLSHRKSGYFSLSSPTSVILLTLADMPNSRKSVMATEYQSSIFDCTIRSIDDRRRVITFLIPKSSSALSSHPISLFLSCQYRGGVLTSANPSNRQGNSGYATFKASPSEEWWRNNPRPPLRRTSSRDTEYQSSIYLDFFVLIMV